MANGYLYVGLVYGVTGQEVEFYPPQPEVIRNGAPTAAATYVVHAGIAPNDNTPEFQGTATLDSVSTTVNQASGYTQSNRQRVYLTSVTGIVVGRHYLLTNAQGEREWVTVAAVNASSVDVDQPLAYDYAITSSTFVGLRQSFVVDSTFIQDSSKINVFGVTALLGMYRPTHNQMPPYRVEWRYVVNSLTKRTWTAFDLHRTPAKGQVSIDDLRELWPDSVFGEWQAQRGEAYMPQLRAAERDLYLDIRSAGYDPNSLQDPQAYNRLLLQKWALTIGKGMLFARPEVKDWVDDTAKDFDNMFNKLIGVACRLWISPGATGEVALEPSRQVFLKGR